MPIQQILNYAFTIQEVVTDAPEKLEEQVLDIMDVFLLLLFSHGWFLHDVPLFSLEGSNNTRELLLIDVYQGIGHHQEEK